MLSFETDSPVKCLEVEVDGTAYHIPLADSITAYQALELAKMGEDEQRDFAMSLIVDALGDDVLKKLSSKQLQEIMSAWVSESGVDQGK